MTYSETRLATVFWRHVTVSGGLFDCWLWRGARSQSGRGYGHFRAVGKDWVSSRASWIIHFGPIPDGLQVLHHCDVKTCVRPDHLYLGTQADNIRDSILRTRDARLKLSPDLVRQIRTEYMAGVGTAELGRRYGVHRDHVKRVCTRRTWRYVA